MRAAAYAIATVLCITPAEADWINLASNVQGDTNTLALVKADRPNDWMVSANIRFDGFSEHYNAYVYLNDCLNRGDGVVSFIQHYGPTAHFFWTESGNRAYDVVAVSLCEWAQAQTQHWGVREAGYTLRIGGHEGSATNARFDRELR